MQIAFIGYGELGIQVHGFLKEKYVSLKPAFFDDELFKANIKDAYPFADLTEEAFRKYCFVICLGYKHAVLKSKLYRKLIELDRKVLSFVHGSCFVNNSAIIGDGTIIYPMCNIDKDVNIGNATLLNNSVVVSHDTVIGDGAYLSPGVVLSGNVTIGDHVFLGAGTVVANGVTVGNNVVAGIGTVITESIPDDSFVIGNPMRFVERLQII